MSNLSKRKVALYKHLLHNGKLSIKNAFFDFGISNIAREVRRLIEIPLEIELKRVKKVGTTKDGEPCYWFEYSATDLNKIALKKALDGESKKEVKVIGENDKICDWCNKPKKSKDGYFIGKIDSEKEWFICDECNLIHDVV